MGGARAVAGQREAVAALLDAQPATDAEREAVTWALGVLTKPIDDVVDLDPRFMPLHYETLVGMAFPIARAGGILGRYLGPDAQQSAGRMRRAGLVDAVADGTPDGSDQVPMTAAKGVGFR